MCGICGVASEWLSQSDIKKYMELMHLSVLRGWEGAGTIFVDEGKKLRTRTLRSMGNGTQLILSRKFGELMRDQRKQLLIGHTRFPTRGKKVLENVHPHMHGHIVGVHNGTFKQVNGKWLYGSDRSDSSSIFEDIATRGIDEAIKNCEGAYVLVWVDSKEGTLNFIRNNERPLWFARTKNEGTMYWASEKDYLTTVLDDDMEYTELVPDKHVKYNLPFGTKVLPDSVEDKIPEEPKWKRDQREWDKNHPQPWRTWGTDGAYGTEEKSTVVHMERPSNTRASGIHRHFQPQRHNFNHANAANNTPSISSQRMPPPILGRIDQKAKSEREAEYIETAKGYWCLPSRVVSYLAQGCCLCGDPLDMSDLKSGEIIWGSFSEPICKTCWTSADMHATVTNQFPNLVERKNV